MPRSSAVPCTRPGADAPEALRALSTSWPTGFRRHHARRDRVRRRRRPHGGLQPLPRKGALLLGFITHETEQYAATLQRALDDIEDPTEQLQTYVRQQAALTRVYHLAPGPELRSALSRGPSSASAST